jgi:hypothetical protein
MINQVDDNSNNNNNNNNIQTYPNGILNSTMNGCPSHIEYDNIPYLLAEYGQYQYQQNHSYEMHFPINNSNDTYINNVETGWMHGLLS